MNKIKKFVKYEEEGDSKILLFLYQVQKEIINNYKEQNNITNTSEAIRRIILDNQNDKRKRL